MVLKALNRLDLNGKRVLDIGCRDGLFSFEAEKKGAEEILGIDNDLSDGAVEFLIPFFESKVRMREMNVFELADVDLGKFDVVIFAGVLYHLRYPIMALKLISDILEEGGWLILETAVLRADEENAILFCPIGEESPYEGTSCTFFNQKAMVDTLRSIGLSVMDILSLNKHLAFQKSVESDPAIKYDYRYIDRSAFVCQKTPDTINAAVTQYWEGTHSMHTGQKQGD